MTGACGYRSGSIEVSDKSLSRLRFAHGMDGSQVEIGYGYGSAEKISLSELDPERFHLRELRIGFDTLCARHQVQCSRQLHDRADDRLGLRLVKLLDKRPVDLHLVEWKRGEIAKRRISDAEIVHRNGHAEILQLAQGLEVLLGFPQQDTLGDFELQACRRKLRIHQRENRGIDDVAFGKLNRGEVDRDLDVVRHRLSRSADRTAQTLRARSPGEGRSPARCGCPPRT